MSAISVNIIAPRTNPNVELQGLNKPTYLGQNLALENEHLKLTGGTMTGKVFLSGNASGGEPLAAVPKQQLDSAVTNITNTINALGGDNSLTANGFWIGPGGFCIQWVTVTVSDVSGTATVNATWPRSGGFPTACLSVVASLNMASGNNLNVWHAVQSFNNTGAVVALQEEGAAVNPCSITLFAIGH